MRHKFLLTYKFIKEDRLLIEMDTLLGIISELAREPYYSIPALSLVTVGIAYLSRKSVNRQREQEK